MTDFLINSAKTCAFTGHRILDKEFDIDKVEYYLRLLIKDGIDTFLVGMAIGFDTECFKLLLRLKKEFDIKLVACVPCLEQNKKFTASQNAEYLDLLSNADKKVVVSENYSPYCMMKRNMFMVDNCCVLIAYIKKETGGTFNTVKYAKQVNRPIIYL